jgi:hypothetical protein
MKPRKKARRPAPPKVRPIEDARRKRRQKDVAEASDRIHQATEEAALHLPLTPDGLRFIVGGFMNLLAPLDAKTSIRTEDGRDIPLDGQQLRDVGSRLMHGSMIQTLIRGMIKSPEEKKAAEAKAICQCGHPKSEHVSNGVGYNCLGGGATPSPSPLLPQPVCECRWFSLVTARKPASTP